MHHNFYLVPLSSGLINLALAGFVFFINPRRRQNRIFFVLGAGIAWWNFGTYMLSHIEDPSEALFRVRLNLVAIFILPAAFYHFAVETASKVGTRWKVRAGYAVALVFLVLDFSPNLIAEVRPHFGRYRPTAGPAFWVFCGVVYPIAAYGTLSALVKFKNTVPPSFRRSAKVLLIAVALLFVSGIHDMLPVLGFDHYPGTSARIISWGTLGSAIYAFLVGYSVLSEQLLDVRVSMSRHAATVLRFFFMGGIACALMLSARVIFPSTYTENGVIASLAVLLVSVMVTAQFFPKLFGALTGRLQLGVLGDHFEYQDKVIAFVESPVDWDNAQTLLDDTTALVAEQLNLSAIAIAIVGGDARIRATSTRSTADRAWSTVLAADSPLMKCFSVAGVPQIDRRNDFHHTPEEQRARDLLISESLEIAFPVGSRPNAPFGILVVGRRRDRRALTNLDTELLETLCRKAAERLERIAIIHNEELRQASTAKDRFLASINHEIRNPLNGITGIVNMLRENETNERSRFLLSTLEACTEQLGATMDDVLDFSRIESDSITVTSDEVDLIDLLKTTCATYDITGTKVMLTQLPSTSVFIKCDGGKIRQIVSNYVGNAMKYGVPPGGNVTLTCDEVRPGVARVSFAVISTGPTLDEEEISTLFTALTRGRRARETKAHGTGLGLALSKKLALALGGTVGVTSSEGRTTFSFEAEFPTVTEMRIPEAVSLSRFEGFRALAIEDEPYNRLVLGHYLAKIGISQVWAETGQAALTAARDQTFDVILMDWLLPDMDGAELLQQMKSVRQSEGLPPVIVLSAYSTTNKRAECLAAGASSFVSKPIDFAKLCAAFEQCTFAPRGGTKRSHQEISIDVSALSALTERPGILDSFVADVRSAQTRLMDIWRAEPIPAALLAHRLRGQMALIHANDCAGLLQLMERSLNEKWPSHDVKRIVEDVDLEIGRVLTAII
ncbi:MAG: response regulator [Opitutus sp.]